ncbi:hypothetical protein CVT25_004058 [Psilocybe cyanescens]|uniref:Uncharacterized protein n=1 Tax=Psilocybe cyanescens TaxID=93625 RepID=A0A409WXU2_PSICY|nr:hypothetical protein CVT25_004058 [Psilocybe cyanescens]
MQYLRNLRHLVYSREISLFGEHERNSRRLDVVHNPDARKLETRYQDIVETCQRPPADDQEVRVELGAAAVEN